MVTRGPLWPVGSFITCTNDLFSGASGEDTYNHLSETAQAYKDQGYKVLVLTNIQAGGSGNEAARDEERQDLNNRIRSGGPWDGVVDVAALPEFSDSDNSVTSNRNIYAGDGIHLAAGGYSLIADHVEAALNNLLGL